MIRKSIALLLLLTAAAFPAFADDDDTDPTQAPIPSPAPTQADAQRAQDCEDLAQQLRTKHQCLAASRAAKDSCMWTTSQQGKEFKRTSKFFTQLIQRSARTATTGSAANSSAAAPAGGANDSCFFYGCYSSKSQSLVRDFKNRCEPLINACRTDCEDAPQLAQSFHENQCGDITAIDDLTADLPTYIGDLTDALSACSSTYTNQLRVAEQDARNFRTAQTDANRCAQNTGAGSGNTNRTCPAVEGVADAEAPEEPIAPRGDDTAGAAGAGTTGGGTTAGAEDTDDSDSDKDKKKDDKKKQANNNSNPLGALAGIAGALMNGAAAQNAAATATPVAPMELASDDCRRPERANSDICFCSNPANVRSQRCMGGNSASYNSTFGNPLQGVGGAKLANPTTGPTLNLPSSLPDPGYIGAGNKDNGGGGGGQGMLGGGGYGGLNPGNPNQKPDPPPAKAKSALSADILVGVRGGTNPFGPRGPSAPRISRAYGTPRDPDELRGYNLKADNNPNLQRFLPNRGTAAEGPGQIAGSAAYGVGGIHTADKNIFNEMTNRYRALEDSLLP